MATVQQMLLKKKSKSQWPLREPSGKFCIKQNKRGKIEVTGSGILANQHAQEAGVSMIALAESLENFSQPAPMKQVRVYGKNWRCGTSLHGSSYSEISLPWHNEKAVKQGMVQVEFDSAFTPRIAREIGAYLLSLALQRR